MESKLDERLIVQRLVLEAFCLTWNLNLANVTTSVFCVLEAFCLTWNLNVNQGSRKQESVLGNFV